MTFVERWWLTDYTAEIYVYLRQRERRRMTYKCQSPQLRYRRSLVTFISDICGRMDFCVLVKHLSVHLLDFYMDSHNVGAEQLQLLALGCIVVAAKAEEKDCRNPHISEISKLMGNTYSPRDIGQVERAVLDFFQWEVHHPTVAHFLDYFAVFAIFPTDVPFHARMSEEVEDLRISMRHYLNYFLEASLKDYSFIQMPASMVAAACIVCSRACLCLTPIWSLTLEKVSDYTLEQLAICTNHLLTAKDRDDAESGAPTERPEEASDDLDAVGFPYHNGILAAEDAESRREDHRAAQWPLHSSQYEL
ncbi:cyclin-J [Dermacentor andersoni]|uniref:cyclin-J n=1 Tax=Dermacentor andersoni TaxID=34620 RepID=UPI002155ADEF|nr:cyclin-J-like [Dermacentor andersoni]XP_050050494.1 cyclin-J-like [Dermacentor andersoni]XP_054917421.1 cyclin-J-like [Dermacentor andersoni]